MSINLSGTITAGREPSVSKGLPVSFGIAGRDEIRTPAAGVAFRPRTGCP